MPDREPILLKHLAQQVRRQLSNSDVDCIFAPNSCVASHLRGNLPVVFCADATFANMIDFYGEFSNCSDKYLRQGHEQERQALKACAAAIYPSEWAARSAIHDYEADPAKVHVLPFGANVTVPPLDVVTRAIERRREGPFRVLFVGKEYWRKGADIVLKACDIAVKNGVSLHLDLVGLEGVEGPLPPYATDHGNLTKRDPRQRRKLEDLFLNANLLFVPSRAEAYGIVFCEAACNGVPALTASVGGIPGVVQDGISGIMLPPDSSPEAFADALRHLASDRSTCDVLSRSARGHYDNNLSWDVFGDRLVEIMAQVSGR
jgi:hypothetical protein